MKSFVRGVFWAMVATGTLAWGQAQPKPVEPAKKPDKVPAAEPAKPPAKKRLVADLSGFEISDPKRVTPQRALLGATRGGSDTPVLLAPRMGKFYGDSPLLAWTGQERESFEIVMRDEEDNEVLRQRVSATEFRVSKDSAQLLPGHTYFWSVRRVGGLVESTPSDVAAFVVVSEVERRRIENELAASAANDDAYQAASARAEVLVQHRLWYDAIGAYTDLIKRYPEKTEPYEKRGMVYAQLKVTQAQANADFARADELGSSRQAP